MHAAHEGTFKLEEPTMKLHATIIAIAIAACSATAAAGNQQSLPTLRIVASDISGCAPPVEASRCENFHRWIRANFSEHEIGMLFGNRSSYPEYLTGGIDALQRRYQTLLQAHVDVPHAAGAPIAAN
ncbi:MAG: hypothetical protein ABT18_08760 [Rhodanobacter sp. SCN 66-43]|nr:MAG: hypothetical protein ABT18_08760 [Rhodanobacter sp. SCN 66-43]